MTMNRRKFLQLAAGVAASLATIPQLAQAKMSSILNKTFVLHICFSRPYHLVNGDTFYFKEHITNRSQMFHVTEYFIAGGVKIFKDRMELVALEEVENWSKGTYCVLEAA